MTVRKAEIMAKETEMASWLQSHACGGAASKSQTRQNNNLGPSGDGRDSELDPCGCEGSRKRRQRLPDSVPQRTLPTRTLGLCQTSETTQLRHPRHSWSYLELPSSFATANRWGR